MEFAFFIYVFFFHFIFHCSTPNPPAWYLFTRLLLHGEAVSLSGSGESEFQQGSFQTICAPGQHKKNQGLIHSIETNAEPHLQFELVVLI